MNKLIKTLNIRIKTEIKKKEENGILGHHSNALAQSVQIRMIAIKLNLNFHLYLQNLI